MAAIPPALSESSIEQLSGDILRQLELVEASVGGQDMVEYIVLLVRNQRSQDQVVEELGLFFNEASSASRFTEWLFERLASLAELEAKAAVSASSSSSPSTGASPPALSQPVAASVGQKRSAPLSQEPQQSSSSSSPSSPPQSSSASAAVQESKEAQAVQQADAEAEADTPVAGQELTEGSQEASSGDVRPAKRLKVALAGQGSRKPRVLLAGAGGGSRPAEDADADAAAPAAPAAPAVPAPAPAAPRCRYWPDCKAGSECTYHHPTVNCKYFPHCGSGQACRWLHPPCRFGGRCRNPHCSFVHYPAGAPGSSAGVAGSSGGSLAGLCRYDPKCTKIQCSFAHPVRDAQFKDMMLNSSAPADGAQVEEGSSSAKQE